MDIRTIGMMNEVQVNEKLRVTRVWTKVTKAIADELMTKTWKGRPLYETRATPKKDKQEAANAEN